MATKKKKKVTKKKITKKKVSKKKTVKKKSAKKCPIKKKTTSAKPTMTNKQAMFIKEYLVDLNGTQAAIRAGYGKLNARQQATENLAKPYIREAIQKEVKKRQERLQVTADNVVERYRKIAFMNTGDYLDSNIEYEYDEYNDEIKEIRNNLDLKTLEEMQAAGLDTSVLPEIEIQRGKTDKIKISQQAMIKALDALARHTGVGNASTETGRERNFKAIAKRVSERLRRSSKKGK